MRFTNKVGERKPKADLHLSVFGRKSLGCESPIKSWIACGGQQAETLSWRLIVRVFRAKNFPVERLCESFAPKPSRWGDCASLSRHRLSVGPIVRVFRSKNFPVGRLCESFEPQTSRWGDCARLSAHRLLGGAIVRVFRSKTISLGRLCESFEPQTSRWADCARQSFAKKPFRGCDFSVQFTG